MNTTAPSSAPIVSLAWIDTIGLVGTGVAIGVGSILYSIAWFFGSKKGRRFNTFDALFLAGFIAAVTAAASGVAILQANSRSVTRTIDLPFTVPVVLRCLVPVCILLHIQYYKFLQNHWNWKSDIVKLVIFNMEAMDVIFVMTPILNGNVYVELEVNIFDLFTASVVYAALLAFRQIHIYLVFRKKGKTRASRSNIVYRSISLNMLGLNVVVLLITFLPLSVYLAVHTLLGWKSDDRPGIPTNTKPVKQVETRANVLTDDKDEGKETRSSPTISRVELLAYFASLGVDIFLVVDLSPSLDVAPVGNSVIPLVNKVSFGFAICLIGLDIATLKSYFAADETLKTVAEEKGELSRAYTIYLASSRIETYLLLALLGFLGGTLGSSGSASGQDPLGLIFVAVDYIIVMLRLWLRLVSIAQVQAFDIDRIGLFESFFPLNIIFYAFIAAFDVVLGLMSIPAIAYGSFQVLVHGRWLPKGNLQRFLELASTHAY